MDVETGTTKFDLQLGLDDRVEGLKARFTYNADLFDHATIVNLKTDLLELLDEIATSPDDMVAPVVEETAAEGGGRAIRGVGDGVHDNYSWPGESTAMPPAEWSGRRTEYPRNSSIQKLFEDQVRRTPSAIALIFGETQWSYDRLNRAANRLAQRLQKLGVTRDVPVGVLMERSPEMIMALLGILKAGGAYVPLDPSYPVERLAFMANDTQMPVILTHNDFEIAGLSAKTLWLDADPFDNEDERDLSANTQAEDLAYIIYTSGSTGTPKGVAIPHRGVVRLVKNADFLTLSADETFLQLAPISFDPSTLEIWGRAFEWREIGTHALVIPDS